MGRLIAFIILLIPGIMAAYGIKLMRDSVFNKLLEPYPVLWLQFSLGLLFTILGIGFFAGFLLNRDRKKGTVSKRFQK
ncbi:MULTISPECIES: DUF2627 domain-containing protein [Planococcaceae]|uniref:DUF2627 domain-containing protein n=1 Tax=Planococcus halotolerans TaxID=2233542 RepID=A0A365KU56_9BACL|nr:MULTISPECIES: DUF2627 domain-containing protein [Planococcaceae]QHJ71442.1 DUF2627 family protein [Planococcus halotolerans]RAZ76704.1 DUF2627 domain-containing protein [Planococcus halotolerans]RLQ92148.1 DUF2627 domain-containing protein [Planomicrobium sp. Y74]